MTYDQWYRWTATLARCILYLLIVFCGCLVLGFLMPMRYQFVDVSMRDEYSRSPIVNKIEADGNVLRISVNQQRKGLGLTDIKPRLIDGDVYLDPRYISSVVRQTEFSIDLSDGRFPKNWKEKLYWVEGESWTPLYLSSRNRVHEIKRRKIAVE